MKKSFLLLLPALSLVWGLSSCKRDLQRPSWDIGVVGPVIHSSLGLGNMIADSLKITRKTFRKYNYVFSDVPQRQHASSLQRCKRRGVVD
ncbi:MAG: hypothetical protein ACK40M_13195, partial [Flavobacteriales bacterium]